VWEQLRRTEIEWAKQLLVMKRAETLRRHAEELNSLDNEQAELERFARLVAAFAGRHLISSASASSPTSAPEEDTTQAVATRQPSSSPAASQDEDVLHHHRALPSFRAPFRKLAEDSFSLAALIATLGPSA
jgi:hypothetical protein